MIEVKDRIPTKPRRILITPENEAAPFYATWSRADDPVEEGTPLNKLLFDSIDEGGFQFSELDDLQIETKTISVSEGWTTVKFAKPFEGAPVVVGTAIGNENAIVLVTNITNTSCQIAVRSSKVTVSTNSARTSSSATTWSSNYTSTFTYVSGVNYGNEFVASKVNLIAVYDGSGDI